MSTMGWIYGVFMVALIAWFGAPMLTTHLQTQEVLGECLDAAFTSSSRECLKKLENRLETQATVARTVVSVLPGAPSVPEKKAEQ